MLPACRHVFARHAPLRQVSFLDLPYMICHLGVIGQLVDPWIRMLPACRHVFARHAPLRQVSFLDLPYGTCHLGVMGQLVGPWSGMLSACRHILARRARLAHTPKALNNKVQGKRTGAAA